MRRSAAKRSSSASAAMPGRCLIRRCSSGCGVGDGDESRCGCGASDVAGCCAEEGYRVHFEPIDSLIRFGKRWRGTAREALEPSRLDGRQP